MGCSTFLIPQHRPPETARQIFKSIVIGDRRSTGQGFGNGYWLLPVQMYMSPNEAMKSALLTMFHHASEGTNKERLSLPRRNYWSDENETELARSDNRQSKEPAFTP